MDSKTVENIKKRWTNLIALFQSKNEGKYPSEDDFRRYPRMSTVLEAYKSLPEAKDDPFFSENAETVICTPKNTHKTTIFATPDSSGKNKNSNGSKMAHILAETPEFKVKNVPATFQTFSEPTVHRFKPTSSPLKVLKNRSKVFPNPVHRQISELDSPKFSPVKQLLFSGNKFGKNKRRRVFFSPESTQKIIKLRTNIDIQSLNNSPGDKNPSFLQQELKKLTQNSESDTQMKEPAMKHKLSPLMPPSKRTKTVKPKAIEPNFVRLNLRHKTWRSKKRRNR